jgi:hypothetical protein
MDPIDAAVVMPKKDSGHRAIADQSGERMTKPQ